MSGRGVDDMDNEVIRLLGERGVEDLPEGADTELLAAIREALPDAGSTASRPSGAEFLERLGRWQPVLAGGIAAVLVAGIFIASPSGTQSVGGSRTINQLSQEQSSDAAAGDTETPPRKGKDLADKSQEQGAEGSGGTSGARTGGRQARGGSKGHGGPDGSKEPTQSARQGDKSGGGTSSAFQGSSDDVSTAPGNGQPGEDSGDQAGTTTTLPAGNEDPPDGGTDTTDTPSEDQPAQ